MTIQFLCVALLSFPALGKNLASVEGDLSADRYLDRVKLLASEDLEGRETGSPGQKAAAVYIANQFRKFGLDPVGDEKGYFQGFAVDIRRPPRPGKGSRFLWSKGGEEHDADKRSFLPFGFSKKGEVKGPAVFVGYAITSRELDYDDFAGVDVKGKIALCMRHSPGEAKPDSRFGPVQMQVATFINKAKAAEAAGASALVLVNDTNHKEDDLMALAVMGEPSGIPVMQVSREQAQAMLKTMGKDLAAVQKEIDESLKPRSFAIEGVEIDLFVDIDPGEQRKAETQNVVGLLLGSDPEKSKEYIVIGAHMDHVGYGYFGAHPRNRGKLHYGADDNASGSAAVIELARAFSQLEPRPKRSILFMAFSGEELDLLGSAHYVKNPIFPLADTVLMLNFDMVGRSKDGHCEVSGLGTADALENLVASKNEGIGLDLKLIETVPNDSDHYNFAKAKIPVAFFFTGFHPDYHQPTDTWEKINAADGVRVIRLGLRIAAEAADAPSRMPFTGMTEGN